jgi:hypothetical protein
MRKHLLATILVLFSVPAVVAQETTTVESVESSVQKVLAYVLPDSDDDRWRYVAVGAGVLGGIWAANVLTAGILMPIFADGGIGFGGAAGIEGLGVDMGFVAASEALAVLGGAAAGGYFAGWLYDR